MFFRAGRGNGVFVAIIFNSFMAAPALAENAALSLAAELHQTLTESPESLRWLAPNHSMELTHENIGLEPNKCSQPVPAMVGKTYRFLVRCETSQIERLRRVDLLTVTSWTHSGDGWQTGQIVSVNQIGASYRHMSAEDMREILTEKRKRILLPLGTHKGHPSGPFEEAFALFSQPRLDKLNALWETLLAADDFSLAALESWRQFAWPDGLVGLCRDGQLLLQKGSLTGAGELLEKLDQDQGLPPFVQGLIRPIPSIRSWQNARPPGEPMFMLDMMYANRKDYVIAISDKAPESSQNNIQSLSDGQPYHLVFMPIERNL